MKYPTKNAKFTGQSSKRAFKNFGGDVTAATQFGGFKHSTFVGRFALENLNFRNKLDRTK